MRSAANAVREAGLVTIGSNQLDSYLSRYDAIVREGLDANPMPAGRKRDSLERESYNLVSAFCKLRKRSHPLRLRSSGAIYQQPSRT